MTIQMSKLVGLSGLGDYVVPVISKDPPKSYQTAKYEPVSVADITYLLRDEGSDRLVENINQYARGVDPMARPGSQQHNTTKFTDSGTTTHVQVRPLASNLLSQFRPNIRLQDDYAISRMPWRFSQGQHCETKLDIFPQRDVEERILPTLEAKTQNSFTTTGVKGEYNRIADQVHLTEYSGVITDNHDLAYVTTGCHKKGAKDRPQIDFDAIVCKMKEIQQTVSYTPISSRYRANVYNNLTCPTYENWKNTRNGKVDITVGKKFRSIDAQGTAGIDINRVRNKELATIGLNGTKSNNNNYTDQRGLVGVEDYISEHLNVDVQTNKVAKNSSSPDRSQVFLNSRNKELNNRQNTENKPMGVYKTTQNVVDRLSSIPIDLSKYKMSI